MPAFPALAGKGFTRLSAAALLGRSTSLLLPQCLRSAQRNGLKQWMAHGSSFQLANQTLHTIAICYRQFSSYSEVQEVDNHGHVCEVIVIDDTPPPPTTEPPATHNPPRYHPDYLQISPPSSIRTRAHTFSESQALAAFTAPTVQVAPAQKKRKQDQADEPRGTITKKPAPHLQPQVSIPSTKSWASGSATTDLRNNLPVIINSRHLIHPCAHLHHQASNGVVLVTTRKDTTSSYQTI
ncbi:hypothetical protein SCLCIDRAFT_18920 [Scleroderma citrinum Foug A]|uniref:Uncharacterized protein n=1 Tax=Scleroderma citrinum Foug A TaxID=1036808 RepID=A0A0C3AY24_9AGAM|nr:hypothetical protein SCLCIDRAFT_18920 [Scleroderma citrinum Foug A]